MDVQRVGQTLGKYRIVRKIGEGGMGTVYEARHELLDFKVAVKVLADNLLSHEEAAKRFIQEGQFLARLRHDNIVSVFDLGQEKGLPYLAMEFIEGKPLSWLIEQQGKVKPPRALDITRQVADGLAAAHEESVVHRDIKPDNIMVNHMGKVKVMDFGIAKEIDTLNPSLTALGSSIGTMHYMSPEQCQKQPVDGRSDLFSLGIVLFEMLCGELPFPDELPYLELMNAIAKGPVPSAHETNEAITEAVSAIVSKLTATDPEERYDSASEVSDDIRHVIRMKTYRSDTPPSPENKRHHQTATNDEAPTNRVVVRSEIGRREADRQQQEEIASLRRAIERAEGGQRAQRYAVRKKCKALLHEDCVSIIDIDMGVPPRNVKLLDLSEGGASLFVDEALASSSRHVVELHMDDGHIVRSPAVVMWTRYIEKRDGFATGLQFSDMPRDEEANLLRALARVRQNTQSEF